MKFSQLYLRLDLGRQWRGRDIFSTVARLRGDIYRNKEGRRTLRFTLADKSYFLKYHRGVGWTEIVKNLLQGRKPIISARNEWHAIKFLQQHDIGTMTLAGYGERGLNPAKKESFVITDDLSNTMSLEHLGRQWRSHSPSFASKKALIEKLALITKTMHENGMNHRDYYLCHFLLDESFAEHNTVTADTELFLIDLHRAQLRHRRPVPKRWLIKDLASLYFSAMDVSLTQRDLIRFMRCYSGADLREMVRYQDAFWTKVRSRAQKMRGAEKAAIDVELNPLRAFLQGHKGVSVPFKLQAAGHAFDCYKVLRLLPGKRLVVAAQSEQQHVVVKLFAAAEKGQRELEREYEGHRLATEAGVSVPELVFAGDNQQGCLMVIYRYIEDGQTLSQLSVEDRKHYLAKLFACISQLHKYGIYQHDIHLDNFLSAENELYLLDLSSIKKQRPGEGLTERQSLKNLARLVAQFTLDEHDNLLPYIKDYFRSRGATYNAVAQANFIKLCRQAWQKRKNNYLKKCFRNCTMTQYYSHSTRQAAFRSDFLSGDTTEFIDNIEKIIAAGTILKAGNSATVVKTTIAGQDIVIKRYNIKGWQHALKRCLQPSRAAVSWRNANLLAFMGIATPRPLGFIEIRKMGLRNTAYFISEYRPADDMLTCYQQRAPSEEELQQLKQLFQRLRFAKVSHGDLKATNLLIDEQGRILLIDLDAMRQHPCKRSFDKAFSKDEARFLANWQNEQLANTMRSTMTI